jgi:hypothetical protein
MGKKTLVCIVIWAKEVMIEDQRTLERIKVRKMAARLLLVILAILLMFPEREIWAGKSMSPTFPGKILAPTGGDTIRATGIKAEAPIVNGGDMHPTLAINAKTPIVDAGTIRTGDFCALVVFTVEANREKVIMFLEGSDLHKGGNPSDNKVGPIPLNTSKPAEIIAHHGKRNSGLPNTALWNGAGDPIAGFPSKKTETVTYESGQKGQFKQDVSCRIWYTQPVAPKATGQYSGKVKLTAMIGP